MRSCASTSFTTPRRRVCPTRRSAWCIHPSRRRPSAHGVKGLPLVGARDLLLRGRILGLRCTHPKAHTTHGHTSTTPEQEAPGDRSSDPNLGQKPKLGG